MRSVKAAIKEQLSEDQHEIPDIFQFLSKGDLDTVITNHAMITNDLSGNAKQVLMDSVLASFKIHRSHHCNDYSI